MEVDWVLCLQRARKLESSRVGRFLLISASLQGRAEWAERARRFVWAAFRLSPGGCGSGRGEPSVAQRKCQMPNAKRQTQMPIADSNRRCQMQMQVQMQTQYKSPP